MKNGTKHFPDSHDTIDWVNSTGAAVASGAAVNLGQRYGIANKAIAINATGVLNLLGEFSFAKAAATTLTQGAVVTLDGSNELVVWNASATTPPLGVVTVAPVTNATSGLVAVGFATAQSRVTRTVVSAGQATANVANIPTPFGTGEATACITQVRSAAGAPKVEATALLGSTQNVVTGGSSGNALVAGDVITCIFAR